MHYQNVNNVRRDIRDSSGLDIEHVSATLTAATDPTATRKMFELERALAQLPLQQQQVILLVGLKGMSYEDAAGILMIRVGRHGSLAPIARPRCSSQTLGYGGTLFVGRLCQTGLMPIAAALGRV